MNTPPHERLIAEILAILGEGLPQDESVLHAVAATHGDASPQVIAAVLSQRDSSDAATLAAMLLFPDAAVRERIEPLALTARCTQQDAQALGNAVEQAMLLGVRPVAILLPGGARVMLPLEPGDAAVFVDRLRLADTPPEALTLILDERFNKAEATRLATMLRTCRLRWNPARVGTVARLLAGLGQDATGCAPRESAGVLAWTLSWLDSLGPEALNLPEMLGAKHLELTTQLRRAVDFNRAFSQSSFEVMMSQGVRAPLMHPDAIPEELALLDRACRILTGSPAWILSGLTEVDLGTVDVESDSEGEAMISALGGAGAGFF